jgi:eukaryotic-like serine/threonine-protein kinase
MPPSVANLLTRLQHSGLFDAVAMQQVQRIAQSQPSLTPESLTNELVQQKLLTPFQATALLSDSAPPLVIGNYILTGELGEGGMGKVCCAWHRRLKRHVALKTLSDSCIGTAEKVAQFRLEAEAAGQLDHPNIVHTYDAGEANGIHYLAMQYINGMTLDNLVQRFGPLRIDDAIALIIQAAHGLAFAHENGVVHRDIKPANLILGTDGILRILDMGLARTATICELTDAEPYGVAMGSADFLSPDQTQPNAPTDPRGDIYSLGCTLYYLLTARPLYEGESAVMRMLAHCTEPVPFLSDARSGIKPLMDVAFQKMVAKQPSDRYQSAAAVIEALQTCGIGPIKQPDQLKELVQTCGSTAELELPKISFDEDDSNADMATAPLPHPAMPPPRAGKRLPRRRLVVTGLATAAATSALVIPLLFVWPFGDAWGNKQRSPPLAAAASPDQAATIWAFAHGGTVQVNDDGVWRTLTNPADLSQRPLRLISIQLGGNKAVDDDGLAYLSGVTNLQMLWLGGASITDRGLAHLAGLQDLRYLSLTQTTVSDAGLPLIAGLQNLRTLRLEGTLVTDAGVPLLLPLQELEFLDLRATQLTDASVPILARFKNIAELDLRDTGITAQGIKDLQGAVSRCRIQY